MQIFSNSNEQDDTNQASASGSHNIDQDQVTSTSSQPNDHANTSNQVSILQPTNVARDHPLDQSLVILQEVFKQDQDWHHFVSTSHLCHLLKDR